MCVDYSAYPYSDNIMIVLDDRKDYNFKCTNKKQWSLHKKHEEYRINDG